MTMCPECDTVYDESEDAYCPVCYYRRRRRQIFKHYRLVKII